MRIFFDLDGTLLDSRRRLYELFCFLTDSSTISFEEYWQLKREKVSNREILYSKFSYSLSQYTSFQTQWMEMIEQPEWLLRDKPFEAVIEFLACLKEDHRLYVVTARQRHSGVLSQISMHGLAGIFSDVFVTEQKVTKYDLVSKLDVSASDWIVGDTGHDINTGKRLGIHTAAVLSGFLGKDALIGYQPDIIAERVTELKFNIGN